MLDLDPRLFPLFETLNSAGVDWLTLEILIGLQRGVEAEETPEALAAASRTSAREKAALDVPSEWRSASTPAASRPMSGDEQIEWAADYIRQRLEASCLHMASAFATLDAIVDGKDAKAPRINTVITLQDGDRRVSATAAGIASATKQLAALSDAITEWRNQSTHQVTP